MNLYGFSNRATAFWNSACAGSFAFTVIRIMLDPELGKLSERLKERQQFETVHEEKNTPNQSTSISVRTPNGPSRTADSRRNLSFRPPEKTPLNHSDAVEFVTCGLCHCFMESRSANPVAESSGIRDLTTFT